MKFTMFKKIIYKFRFNFLFFLRQFIKNELNFYRFKNYFLILIAAFLAVFAFDFFIAPTGKYGISSTGIGAIARLISINIPFQVSKQNLLGVQTTFYFLIFFGLNTPLLIFSLIKIGVRFSFNTIIYMLLQIVINSLIVLHNNFLENNLHFFTNFFYLWKNHANNPGYRIWLFLFALVGGSILGISMGLVYYGNSSTGGTDFITMYYSVKRNKSIGRINKYVNIFILLIIMLIQISKMNLKDFHSIYLLSDKKQIWEYRIQYLFGCSMLASLFIIFLQSIIINIIYPKYEFKTIFVITKKPIFIIKLLKEETIAKNFVSVWESQSKYCHFIIGNQGYKIIMTNITLLEFNKLNYMIKKIDQNAEIYIQKVEKIKNKIIYPDNE